MGYFGSVVMCPTASNDAEFRVWGKSISNLFSSCSWVTESTVVNAIQWAAVTKSSAANIFSGFEVWKMNDGFATGSLKNLYLRIDYGTGRTIGTNFHVGYGISLGMSCSMSGSISSGSGAYASRSVAQQVATTSPGVLPYYTYVSGDPSRIQILFYGTGSVGAFSDVNFHSYLAVERLKNASGNDTGEGVHRCHLMTNDQPTNSPRNYCSNLLYTGSIYGLPASGAVEVEGRYQAIVSSIGNYDFRMGVGLHIPIIGYSLYPVLGSIGIGTNDCPPFGSVFTVPIYGVNHTYMSLKNTGAAVIPNAALQNPFRLDTANTANNFIAMRYE